MEWAVRRSPFLDETGRLIVSGVPITRWIMGQHTVLLLCGCHLTTRRLLINLLLAMGIYDFTLTFALGQSDSDPEAHLERLAKAGCDDALIGLGRDGRIALNFTREARSAYDAILSALSDVKQAIPDAQLIEASPDLVGLTDIAELLGFSRQNMRMLMVRSGADFPSPVHEGKPAIWHLAKVLWWLREKRQHRIDESLFDIARVSMQCNLLRETTDLDPRIAKHFRSLVN